MWRIGLIAITLALVSADAASAAPRYLVLRGPTRGVHAPVTPIEEVHRAPYAWGWFGARGHSPGTYHRDYYNDTWRFGVQW